MINPPINMSNILTMVAQKQLIATVGGENLKKLDI